MNVDSKAGFTSRLGLVLGLAFLVSFYLLYHFVAVKYGFQIERSFCAVSGSFDCDEVARSRYSEIFGIPLAGWGIFFYSLFSYFVILIRRAARSGQNWVGLSDVLFFLAASSIVTSVGLFLVSHFLITKLCLFCCVLYFANFCLFALLWLNNPQRLSIPIRFFTGLKTLLFGLTATQLKGAMLVGIATLSLGYFSPELLVENYFKPRELRNVDRVLLEPLFRAWKSALVRDVPFSLDGPEPDFHLGNVDAKVVIVEFSDFECPICKSYARYLHKIFQTDLADKVLLIAKSFPLDQSCNEQLKREMHKFACDAASYARCAGVGSTQRFWSVHNGLMDLFDTNKDTMKELVLKLGVADDSFNSCINDPRVVTRIKQDIDLGRKLGIQGTPTFFINGKQLPQVSPERFEGVLRMIVAEATR
jgi:protein-disulfide isomerase/uncharacterized membrane protein